MCRISRRMFPVHTLDTQPSRKRLCSFEDTDVDWASVIVVCLFLDKHALAVVTNGVVGCVCDWAVLRGSCTLKCN
eukprot:jgi/Chrzof1/9397/Cz04g01150.t1